MLRRRMHLRDWRVKHGRGALARLTREGFREGTLIDICRGHVPRASMAKRIAEATRRITPADPVTAEALLGLDTGASVVTDSPSATLNVGPAHEGLAPAAPEAA